jgi:hypothetical protein
METLQVPVRKDIFERLQKLAVPLVDDVNAVLDRLLMHWESSRPSAPIVTPKAQASVTSSAATLLSRNAHEVWICSRGEALPIGAELRADYLGKTYRAKVTSLGIEFNGKHYDNPSSAGIAVKNGAGTRGSAASTNGWEFWEILEPDGKRWISIDAVRKGG